jgi:hypothetical protein
MAPSRRHQSSPTTMTVPFGTWITHSYTLLVADTSSPPGGGGGGDGSNPTRHSPGLGHTDVSLASASVAATGPRTAEQKPESGRARALASDTGFAEESLDASAISPNFVPSPDASGAPVSGDSMPCPGRSSNDLSLDEPLMQPPSKHTGQRRTPKDRRTSTPTMFDFSHPTLRISYCRKWDVAV